MEVICLGRRTQDGNYTGGKGQNCYTDRNGVTRLSPIANWKHEEVLAVIHYFMGRNMPPIYDWKTASRLARVYGLHANGATLYRTVGRRCMGLHLKSWRKRLNTSNQQNNF